MARTPIQEAMKRILLTIPFLTLLMLSACEEKKTTGEKVEDKIKDGLDARPGEKLKDAGEDVKDAVKDATN